MPNNYLFSALDFPLLGSSSSRQFGDLVNSQLMFIYFRAYPGNTPRKHQTYPMVPPLKTQQIRFQRKTEQKQKQGNK